MNNKGFVFMETIIVICVLSLTMTLLFSSYSYLLRKTKEKDFFDNPIYIYKTYFVKRAMESTKGSVKNYITNGSNCDLLYENAYSCDIKKIPDDLVGIKNTFNIEKIYYLIPIVAVNNDDYLFKYDATTIDYINKKVPNVNKPVLLIKFKKEDATGNFEIHHASLEV